MEQPASVAPPFNQGDVIGQPVVMPQPAEIGVQGAAANPTMPTSVFATTSVDMPAALSLGDLTTYNAVVNKLNRLFEDQMSEVEQITDEHWKNQEFPLARIKKIMRMDEEVKMISGEVPIMLSKAIEIFITELSLRAWLHTEEAKRRTVQRSDIAMAITKNDMFDFLIDIVPREEIQMKTKAGHKAGEGEHLQLLSPDVLQLCLQQLAQQQAGMGGGGRGAEGGEDEEQAQAATRILEQQLQLLQQLIQLQQMQVQELEQQSASQAGQTVQLQHPPPRSQSVMEQPQSVPGPVHGVLNQSQVLQSSNQMVQTQPLMMNMGMSGAQVDFQPQVTQAMANIPGGQRTLHHEVVSDQQILDAQSRSATVVIQPPLLEAQSQQLETQAQYQLHHPPQEGMQMQSIVQQVLVPTQVQQFTSRPPGTEGEGVEFQHIPESESISRSISPIAATLQSTSGEVSYTSHTHSSGLPDKDTLQSSNTPQLGGSGTTEAGMNPTVTLDTLHVQSTISSTVKL